MIRRTKFNKIEFIKYKTDWLEDDVSDEEIELHLDGLDFYNSDYEICNPE